MKKELLFFMFPLLVAARVFTTPEIKNIYLRYSDLDQHSMTFYCTLEGEVTLRGNLSWNIPPDLLSRSNVSRENNGYEQVLTISSLRAGDRRNICCTYTENESSCSFLNLTVLPGFRNVSDPVIYQEMYLGIRGSISIPAYLGNPKTGISCTKDGQVLDNHYLNGTELVFPTVRSSHAGTYNCTLDVTYPLETEQYPNPPYLIINVRVKNIADDTHLNTVEGATETLNCEVEGDNLTITWRVGGNMDGKILRNGSLDGRILISADGHQLQLTDIRKRDFNRKFLCIAKTNTHITIQKTILFYRENLAVCTMKEDNTKIVSEIIEETLKSFLDEDCSDDECLVDIREMSFNHKGNGVYEVSGTVISKGQVVKRLNDTISNRDKYITRGLTMTLQCSTVPTTSPTSPTSTTSTTSTLTQPQNLIVMISAVGIAILIFIAVLVLLLMKFSCRSNRIDVEAAQQPS